MRFVFINGKFDAKLSDAGVLSGCIELSEGSFILRVPSEFCHTDPVYLLHRQEKGGEQTLRQTIIVQAGAQMTLVDLYEGQLNEGYQNYVTTELSLERNARVYYYKSQREGAQAQHQSRFEAKLLSNSYLATYHVVMGARQAKETFHYVLKEPSATCESLGYYHSQEQQQLQIISDIEHQASHTNSRQLYKGIADGQSKAAFKGLVKVLSDNKGIVANQRNNNLLLSKLAQIDTKPELEIYSDDVRCSHGSTVGQLDEELIFYLRSRGIDLATAQGMLTESFANEVFDSFHDPVIANMMRGVR